jgi:hypothetical protein
MKIKRILEPIKLVIALCLFNSTGISAAKPDSVVVRTIISANTFAKYSSGNSIVLQLPSVAPPKEAVFCRFENRLWQKLGVGIKLRVGDSK